MTATVPYRSTTTQGRDGFRQLLHAEWTKFRTMRGWVIGMIAAALVTVLLGLVGPATSNIQCAGPRGQACSSPSLPVGPDGGAVVDRSYFVHRPLTGDGSITAQITSLTGLYSPDGQPGASPS
jgi:hypothetical protein